MKPCPYCAELVNDEAIRCKHCHGDIHEYRRNLERDEADATQAIAESRTAKLVRIVSGVAGAVALASLRASEPLIENYVVYGLAVVVALPVGAISGAIGSSLGQRFGRLCTPNYILARSFAELGLLRISAYFLPTLFGLIGWLVGVYILGGLLVSSVFD